MASHRSQLQHNPVANLMLLSLLKTISNMQEANRNKCPSEYSLQNSLGRAAYPEKFDGILTQSQPSFLKLFINLCLASFQSGTGLRILVNDSRL